MAIDLTTIKKLDECGFGKAVKVANALIEAKNMALADSDLLAWKDYTAQQFRNKYHCDQVIADTMVALMVALKACGLVILQQDFPPNAEE